MLQDTREMPHSARLMVIDGCQITDEDYQVLVQGYMADIGRPGANMVSCRNAHSVASRGCPD